MEMVLQCLKQMFKATDKILTQRKKNNKKKQNSEIIKFMKKL